METCYKCEHYTEDAVSDFCAKNTTLISHNPCDSFKKKGDSIVKKQKTYEDFGIKEPGLISDFIKDKLGINIVKEPRKSGEVIKVELLFWGEVVAQSECYISIDLEKLNGIVNKDENGKVILTEVPDMPATRKARGKGRPRKKSIIKSLKKMIGFNKKGKK